MLVGERLSAVADAREVGVESFRKTKQNLGVSFVFNGIGVPAAVTGLVGPVWAMVAMVSSVSTILANSFGTRLRPLSPLTLARFLGRWAVEGGRLLRPVRLRELLLAPEPAAVAAIWALAVAAGAVWIVAAGHPYPFPR